MSNSTFSSRSLFGLVNRLDDTDSNSLSHVTDGETTERWVFVVGFNTHGLRGNEFGNAGITRLDELGVSFDCLTRTTVNFLKELSELASNVSSVAIKHWSVTSTDLTRVVKDDDLGVEGCGLLGGVVLGVRADVTTADILD